MQKGQQLSLGDYQLNRSRKVTRSEEKLSAIEGFVNWDRIVSLFSVIDKTDKTYGGRPRKEILMMCKVLFIQYLYNLSDPELEDQLNDRFSFLHGRSFGSTFCRYRLGYAHPGSQYHLAV